VWQSTSRALPTRSTIDFDILDSRLEAIAMLVVEGRLLANLSEDFDTVDDWAALMVERRRRRKLP
jgi:hypothetical protein